MRRRHGHCPARHCLKREKGGSIAAGSGHGDAKSRIEPLHWITRQEPEQIRRAHPQPRRATGVFSEPAEAAFRRVMLKKTRFFQDAPYGVRAAKERIFKRTLS